MECKCCTNIKFPLSLFFCYSISWVLKSLLWPDFSIKLTDSLDSDLSHESGWDNNYWYLTFRKNWENSQGNNYFLSKLSWEKKLSFWVNVPLRDCSQTTLSRFWLFLTCVDIFYVINVDNKWIFLDHLPTSSCKRSLWTTPYFAYFLISFLLIIDSVPILWGLWGFGQFRIHTFCHLSINVCFVNLLSFARRSHNSNYCLNSKLCENSVVDFCASTLLKALKINFLQAFQKCRNAKVR